MKKKIIVSSIMTIVLCLCIIAGSTYALFTSEDKVSISVTAGKVDLDAFVVDKSFTYSTIFNTYTSNTRFENGGDAAWAEKALTINRMAPGDKIDFTIEMVNNSDIDIQYRVAWAFVEDSANMLNEVLEVTGETDWAEWKTDEGNKKTTNVTVTLPTEVNNDYQEKTGKIVFTVYAVQWNGLAFMATPDTIDEMLDNALPGAKVTLSAGDYGDLTIDQELTDVTIVADPAANLRIQISETAKLDNVKFQNFNLHDLEGFGNLGGIISIADNADVDLTFENCVFEPMTKADGATYEYSSVRCQEETAEIEFINCTFNSGKYAFYKSGAALNELIFDNCTFNNLSSWVAQNQSGDKASTIAFTNCEFNNCNGGIYKLLSASGTFTFVNNTLTNCKGHDGYDSKWFSISETLFNSDSVTISGNTLDGVAWNPTVENAKG